MGEGEDGDDGDAEQTLRETYEDLEQYDERINFDPVGREYVYPRLPTFVSTLAERLGTEYDVEEGRLDHEDRRAGRRLAVAYLDGGDLPDFAAEAKGKVEELRRQYVENPERCPYCGTRLVEDYCQSTDCPCPTFPEALDEER